MQPRLLDRDVLEVVDLGRIGEAEDRAHARLGVGVGDLPVGEQLHLLQLLVERHRAEQVVDLALDALAGGLPRRCSAVASLERVPATTAPATSRPRPASAATSRPCVPGEAWMRSLHCGARPTPTGRSAAPYPRENAVKRSGATPN